MKKFLLQFFTWWNGATLGTLLWTRRKGEFVGEDEGGNRYYRERGGWRRWVVYNGEAEASRIPPGWHGWMHYRVDEPPEGPVQAARMAEAARAQPDRQRPRLPAAGLGAQSAAAHARPPRLRALAPGVTPANAVAALECVS